MEDVYYLPPGACEDFYFATNPFDKDYIRGVDEADGPSFSGEFLKTHPKLIEQGMTVYRCNLCNMFHCGHKYNKK